MKKDLEHYQVENQVHQICMNIEMVLVRQTYRQTLFLQLLEQFQQLSMAQLYTKTGHHNFFKLMKGEFKDHLHQLLRVKMKNLDVHIM